MLKPRSRDRDRGRKVRKRIGKVRKCIGKVRKCIGKVRKKHRKRGGPTAVGWI